MRVKTFEAASMQDALTIVKREMGEDAFILSTRSKQGASGNLIEVTAAVDEAQAPESLPATGTYGLRPPLGRAPDPRPRQEPPAPRPRPEQPLGRSGLLQPAPRPEPIPAPAWARGLQEAPLPKPPARPAETAPPPPMDIQPLRKELLEIKGAVEALRDQETRNTIILKELDELKTLLSRIQKQGMPPSRLALPMCLQSLFSELAENDVDPMIAMRLCEHTQRALAEQDGDLDPDKARLYLHRVISDFIPVAPPIQLEPGKVRVAALVGPTGVGKTTTIAKLAAYAKLHLKQKVALVTLDTFRMAAVDQLQQYAQILQVPIHVAITVEDIRSALRFYQDRALVLIDTPGHSPKDKEVLGQLARLLQELPEAEVHLVLSATTKPKDLADIAQRFEALHPSRLIFTKLDETATFGPVLSTLVRVKRPLSYLGTGQEVPEDLEMATSRRVTDLIFPIQPALV